MNSSAPGPFAIELKNVSKKFGRVWVFKNVSASFEFNKKYAITGPNGSGKSTLLKIIAGIITPNQGEIVFGFEEPWQQISYCAPYMELPEELNLAELLAFHTKLRKLNISTGQFIEMMQLDAAKEIRNYSSGMKQRVKLALAFYTESKVLLLDEPTATLDEHWTNWYVTAINQLASGRLVVISSNVVEEYAFCDAQINISGIVGNQ